MLTKHTLLALAVISSSSVFANIPIESRGLSQGSSSSSTPVASSATATSGNMNWDLLQQLQRLETQVRDLRGKIDEQDHQIDQLNKELTNRYTDLDQRLELLQQKIDPTEDDSSNEAKPTSSTPSTSNSVVMPSTQQASGIEPIQANTVTNGTTPPPANTESTPISSTNTSNQVELEKAAYTIALDAYKQGGAKKAIAPMQNFIKNNPNSVYTGNAYFWLAEFNLAIDPPNYDEAKKNYEIVAAKFPNSAKASRALYQLYSISKDVNKNTQTAEVYKKKLVSTYPQSEEAGYFKK